MATITTKEFFERIKTKIQKMKDDGSLTLHIGKAEFGDDLDLGEMTAEECTKQLDALLKDRSISTIILDEVGPCCTKIVGDSTGKGRVLGLKNLSPEACKALNLAKLRCATLVIEAFKKESVEALNFTGCKINQLVLKNCTTDIMQAIQSIQLVNSQIYWIALAGGVSEDTMNAFLVLLEKSTQITRVTLCDRFTEEAMRTRANFNEIAQGLKPWPTESIKLFSLKKCPQVETLYLLGDFPNDVMAALPLGDYKGKLSVDSPGLGVAALQLGNRNLSFESWSAEAMKVCPLSSFKQGCVTLTRMTKEALAAVPLADLTGGRPGEQMLRLLELGPEVEALRLEKLPVSVSLRIDLCKEEAMAVLQLKVRELWLTGGMTKEAMAAVSLQAFKGGVLTLWGMGPEVQELNLRPLESDHGLILKETTKEGATLIPIRDFRGKTLLLKGPMTEEAITAILLVDFRGKALEVSGLGVGMRALQLQELKHSAVLMIDEMTEEEARLTPLQKFRGKKLILQGPISAGAMAAFPFKEFSGNILSFQGPISAEAMAAARLAEFKGTTFCLPANCMGNTEILGILKTFLLCDTCKVTSLLLIGEMPTLTVEALKVLQEILLDPKCKIIDTKNSKVKCGGRIVNLQNFVLQRVFLQACKEDKLVLQGPHSATVIKTFSLQAFKGTKFELDASGMDEDMLGRLKTFFLSDTCQVTSLRLTGTMPTLTDSALKILQQILSDPKCKITDTKNSKVKCGGQIFELQNFVELRRALSTMRTTSATSSSSSSSQRPPTQLSSAQMVANSRRELFSATLPTLLLPISRNVQRPPESSSSSSRKRGNEDGQSADTVPPPEKKSKTTDSVSASGAQLFSIAALGSSSSAQEQSEQDNSNEQSSSSTTPEGPK